MALNLFLTEKERFLAKLQQLGMAVDGIERVRLAIDAEVNKIPVPPLPSELRDTEPGHERGRRTQTSRRFPAVRPPEPVREPAPGCLDNDPDSTKDD